jgi:ABC-type polysaccharide/polyol phosphate export permease
MQNQKSLLGKVVKDFKKYHEYIFFNTKYELKAQVSNTILGYLWWLLDPLIHMLVYTILVTVIFETNIQGFALAVFCALLPWKWFTATVSTSSNTIRSKASILQSTYIPKFVLPLTQNYVNFTKFLFGIPLLFPMVYIFDFHLSFHFFEILIIISVNFLFTYGVSLVIAHYGVFYRDLKNFLGHFLRLWFYLSPGLYTLERIPEQFQWIWWLNPNTTFFESYREVIMYSSSPLYQPLLIWAVISLIIIYFGLYKLNQFDKNYTKII